MKTGLYFGSFNPVHIGHMAIANYVVEYTAIKQVWFVLSPQNPFKKKDSLLPDHTRLELLEAAIGNDTRFRVSDIEFRLPKPSYTIDTLIYLNEKYPGKDFVLIMGTDILPNFHKWKNSTVIEEKYTRYIYPRKIEEKIDPGQHKNTIFMQAPLMEISSEMIRIALKEKKDVRHFLPLKVYELIDKSGYYSK